MIRMRFSCASSAPRFTDRLSLVIVALQVIDADYMAINQRLECSQCKG